MTENGETMKTETTISIKPDTAELDKWVAQVNLLLSHLSFAIDGYLVTRPPEVTEQKREDTDQPWFAGLSGAETEAYEEGYRDGWKARKLKETVGKIEVRDNA
jgi:hypothetical protein